MAFNIWTSQGQLSGLTTKCNPNVIREAGAVVLSGTVFKMVCCNNNGAVGGIFYYESVDGLTSWTAYASNPIAPSPTSFPTWYHIGSTYYLYTCVTGGVIQVRTSADGVTYGAATTAIALGGAGAWDDTDVYQLNLVPGGPVGGLYYAYYEGIHAGVSGEGLATSPDLITWTKGGSNPVFNGVAPMCFQYINGVYYAWAPDSSVPASVNPGVGRFNSLSRWSAPAPSGPWTELLFGGDRVGVMHPSIRADFDISGTGSNAANTQAASIGDPYMLSASGNLYCYWTKTGTNGTQNGINAAVATGVTPLQQVSGYEGMVNFPIPTSGALSLNLSAQATDNFTRANANPIGGNWTPLLAAGTFNQIVSNLCESAAAPGNGISYYNAVSFPNDGWSQVTIHSLTGNTSVCGALYRMSTGGVNTDYISYWAGNTGSVGQLNLSKTVAGAGTTLGSITSFKVTAEDTLMLAVSGTNLLVYYNGFPVLAATDASIASGAGAGLWNGPAATVGQSQIDGWSGGGFVTAPTFAPLGGGSSAGALSLRRRKRRDVIS